MKTFPLFSILLIFICILGCHNRDMEKYIADLTSENVMIKKTAIYYLEKDKEEDAVIPLLQLLKSEQSEELRLDIIDALGNIGENKCVDTLVAYLQNENNEVRQATISALGKIGDSKAVPPLLIRLNNDVDTIITIAALGNIGDNSAIPALTELLGSPDKYIKYNAMQALKKIGENQ